MQNREGIVETQAHLWHHLRAHKQNGSSLIFSIPGEIDEIAAFAMLGKKYPQPIERIPTDTSLELVFDTAAKANSVGLAIDRIKTKRPPKLPPRKDPETPNDKYN